MLVVTRHGAYLSPDALAYVGTARNLVNGHGFTQPPGSPPLGNFPPAYSLILAAFGAFGPDPLTVARFVNPLVFGVTIVLVGVLVRRLTGSLPLAVMAQLLVVTGSDFLMFHSAALSEPVFVLFALLAFVALAASVRQARPVLLLVAAVFAAAACLTRYVGLAVVVAGVVGVLVFGGRHRWRGAVAFAALSLAPLFAWLAWVGHAAGRATNRSAVFHPPGWTYVGGGIVRVSTWVLPAEVPAPVRLVALALVAGLLGWVAWRDRRHARPTADELVAPAGARPTTRGLAGFVGLFAVAYLAALVADRALFDVTGRLDDRFLLPFHAAVIVLAAWALRTVDLRRSHLARIGLTAVVGVHIVSGALWVYDATTDPEVRPGGFASPAWSHSTVIDEVRALPAAAPVYTNEVDALWFHTGRVASAVPEKRIFLTGRPNRRYAAQLGEMDDRLRSGGLLVYFTSVPARRVFLPTPSELAQQLRLEELTRDGIGVVYRVPGVTSGSARPR
jgi:4-amino-4-deoxy-L-arabinose transferase-like glycosyltransferase